MKTFNTAAVALAGICLALSASSASAATIDYVLTGLATGEYLDLSDPSAAPQTFDLMRFHFDFVGDPPGEDIGGTDVVSIDSGKLRVEGVTGRLVLPAAEVFAFDPADGAAAYGKLGPHAFTPTAVLGGPGLVGYDGMTSLSRIKVVADFTQPFKVKVDGDTYQVEIDDFTRAHFAATAVPEPASWALMMAGFFAAGSFLRRRRALAAA